MARISLNVLKMLTIISICFLSACGGNNTGGGPGTDGGSGKFVASCKVSGGLASFEVNCTKEISNIQKDGLSSANSLKMLDVGEGGKILKIEIEKTGPNNLKRSVTGYTTLEFKITHPDGTVSDITVR